MPILKKISMTIIVAGLPQVVDVPGDQSQSFGWLVSKTLRQAAFFDSPSEDWELRDADGNLLDLNKKIRDHGFPAYSRFLLNLKAGFNA